jgi:hypothetical protein
MKNPLKNSKMKLVKKVERYVSKLSPVKRNIGESLLAGTSPKVIVNRMSKGRKTTANAQAYVTMVMNGIEKIIGSKQAKPVVYANRKRMAVKAPAKQQPKTVSLNTINKALKKSGLQLVIIS